MFLLCWPVCCFLLAFHKLACGWAGHDVSKVICSQGLSECTVVAVMPFAIPESDAVDVQTLTAKVELCCKENTSCTLCLLMEAEIAIHVDEDMAKRLQLRQDNEEDTKAATISAAAFVTLCYKTPPTFPACKRVDFTVTPTGLEQKVAKISLVITNPAAVSFSSIVYVYPSKAMHLRKEIVSPSLNEVCSQNRRKPIKECHVPTISSVINQKMNQVELKFAGESNMCIQYEADGRCQSWERKTIPLHSVIPCLCLQVWDDDRRSQSCPFKNVGFLEENVWRNLTASVDRGRMNDKGQMLLWNLTAPCRLEGEVWPCRWTLPYICTEIEGFRQQLVNSTWKQNRNMLWVLLRNGGLHLGPFCSHQTARWRWNLLAVAVLLVIILTALILCLLHDFIKKWASRSFREGCTKICSKGHVVLLSPPDVHNDISEVCGLGSLLRSQGFSVSVDQWSRMEQCNLGPLPWLHSQLLHVKNLGGRAVLILTRKAMRLVQEWSQQHRQALRAVSGDGNLPQSPYSDVFMASLSLILGDKQQGRTGERFLLVTFEEDVARSAGSLPEPFQGLHLFQLPSQMKTLLCELTGGSKGEGRRRKDKGRLEMGNTHAAKEQYTYSVNILEFKDIA
ncbi:interleukin-17 receptor C isoform X2 [Hippocampus zosterae]|uniref:interleukin-17 receptor C isoform X2 n=1 Tax=Hippocampus zosterae TaxID=109293 RepID=UPI00223DA85B|nr:interleukin-17 receptor C isoform X2 [Hippocampus zosterae]